jgi:hypothetical protein
MKPPLVILVLCLVPFAAVLAGCTSSPPAVPPVSPVVTPPPTVSTSCGFSSCHGVDLACSTNPPQACTMEYQLGDKCRQYASCNSTGGTCTLVTTARFDSCKACIKQCGGADPAEAFTCEEKC